MMRSILFYIVFCMVAITAKAQEEQPYITPEDPLVQQKLEQWKDWKFGFMMHWGAYSEWGVVESWSICAEDVPWCNRPEGSSYVEYKAKYENLPQTFNPQKFNPEKWAAAAKYAGMKYVVFTTKHHDGFCMFDTHQTDYKITSDQVPFSSNVRADVTQEIFKAFRKEGLGIGAYFSKPDWHNDDYWWPYFATPDRNVNYDPEKYPKKWKSFQDFTYNQIQELMTSYGDIDILWLDGGWVRPKSSLNKENISWLGPRQFIQDVNMPRIAKMARTHQPGLIVVNRSVHGAYENYRTPEQTIPEKTLPYPWETCMTMGSSWSYNKNDVYKPVNTLIHNLVDIVAKGGNYLLNVGPGPDGELAEDAYRTMEEIGNWMEVNGEAIYKTRPIKPYKEGKICYTSLKHGTVYAFYLAEAGESVPENITLNSICPKKGSKLTLLGVNGYLKWKKSGDGCIIEISKKMRKKISTKHAFVVKIPAID